MSSRYQANRSRSRTRKEAPYDEAAYGDEGRGGSGLLFTVVVIVGIILLVGIIFGTKIQNTMTSAGLNHTEWYGFGVEAYKGDDQK